MLNADKWQSREDTHKSTTFCWKRVLHLWNCPYNRWCIGIIYIGLCNPGQKRQQYVTQQSAPVTESFRVVQPLSLICLNTVHPSRWFLHGFTWLDFSLRTVRSWVCRHRSFSQRPFGQQKSWAITGAATIPKFLLHSGQKVQMLLYCAYRDVGKAGKKHQVVRRATVCGGGILKW